MGGGGYAGGEFDELGVDCLGLTVARSRQGLSGSTRSWSCPVGPPGPVPPATGSSVAEYSGGKIGIVRDIGGAEKASARSLQASSILEPKRFKVLNIKIPYATPVASTIQMKMRIPSSIEGETSNLWSGGSSAFARHMKDIIHTMKVTIDLGTRQ